MSLRSHSGAISNPIEWRQLSPFALYNHLLLTDLQRDRLNVVLVSPRNPLNIGAAARAMANFGFSRLDVVAPFEAHWREARSAVGAPELLENAQQHSTLAEAVAACTLVIGTGTLTYRKPEQRVVSLPDLAPLIRLEFERSGRIALVFGPEKHGLTRNDLSLCHMLLQIPTDPRQPSMNLGQAVAVCLYELAVRGPAIDVPTNSELRPASTCGDLELLATVVEQTMVSADNIRGSMREASRHELRLMLRRLAPNVSDTRRLLGLFRRILWRLNRAPEGD
ncbi:MAG: RNA methyltransferase [Terracidiphilus sp.]|jgi:tRNA/rRNA methyltransferase